MRKKEAELAKVLQDNSELRAKSGLDKPQHNVQYVGFQMFSDDDFITATLSFRNVPNGKLLGKFEMPRLRVIYYIQSTGEEIADMFPVEWWSDTGSNPMDIGSQEQYAVVGSFFNQHGFWKAVEQLEDDSSFEYRLNSKQISTGSLHIRASLSSVTGLRIPPVEGILTLGEDGTASFQLTKGYIEAI